MALYETQASFVVQPGETVTGTEALRDAFSGFLALKPTFELEVKKVFRAGNIALSSADWPLTGTGPDGETISISGQGTDVLREQQDGS
jgi:ketosteroid isomerase-like protein